MKKNNAYDKDRNDRGYQLGVTQLHNQILNNKQNAALGGIQSAKHLLASVALFKMIKQ